MFLNNSFGKTLDVLHRSMDVEMLRRQVMANNIANADTPNYKRSVVNFESQLARALDSEKVTKPQAALTNERHIPFNRVQNYRDVRPKRVLDYLSESDNNGNNVDVEEESMLLLQNQLRYDMMSRVVAGEFSRVNIVLR
ncbi:flagellar basal body rod protein FlgB [Sediminispirochaeta smaragdinae]|jgi:flagellar basal-body rod protein FlgB|uniref:Flagellar basal body rod protein FlgB n=1 Tax=Sediminispirochaeta smaragdinae (strain DSM 11293 / JCM 15392 / SEBR 4228) TaxID=573413 RepID=E1R5S1_SEDSS|nr:flagellar basal body rod protein FlgB [Sediminispirochaeta smaragdinae]ADK80686.1 flagellar basal-body rod protein FlgB [Sediminispirochaeta smaragdinae DSM 11293]